MKYIFLVFTAFSTFLYAQNIPSNFNNVDLNSSMFTFEKPEGIDELAQAEKINGEAFKFAEMIDCNIDITDHWSVTNLTNGTIWSTRIKANDAKAISLYMDMFWIPTGGELYVYNPEKTHILGPYNSKDNHESGVYAIPLIGGDEVILEYYQPYNETNSPKIRINQFAYAYRNVGGLWGYGTSDNCQVNANCSEGDPWENQKTSVCRIQIGNGVCSGALINNTSGDCRPLVLSADHCFGGGMSANQLNQVIFYFNYESNGCNNSMSNYDAITGCQLLSNSGGEGDNGDSDFFLVELNSEPDFDPYFSGWDRSNVPATSGVSIHHPSGDIKKISTFTQTLTNAGGLSFGNDNTTHWRVYWNSTANGHGVTEGGSSGSPIYNQNGLIVGDLTGGSSYCDATNQPDIYGKLWHGWDQMGNSNSQQLKPWLDPGNTNVMTLNGSYCNPNSVSASFFSNQNEVCINESVTFSSTSSGNINSYSWQFYGGTPSSAVGPGPHNVSYNSSGSFDVILTVDGPNGESISTQNNYINVGQNQVQLDFLPDCYGIETAWVLKNENGETIKEVDYGYYPGGDNAQDMDPNPSNVIENWCLIDGCYTFTVYDDYGDGMNGANPEYACGQNGDYTIYGDNGEILVELTSPNSDFGNQITHNFCVESDAPQASWRCINFECVDPLDGSGQYSSFNDCIAQCSPPSSINETNTEELIAFPNPFDQKITLISEENGTVNVYNILSQLVVSQTKENNKLELNLSNLENGIYFVELNNKLIKIIKE
ncbi:MAG: T9SS type A sorting domain-containing protein [Flavobacteriales bacterium]